MLFTKKTYAKTLIEIFNIVIIELFEWENTVVGILYENVNFVYNCVCRYFQNRKTSDMALCFEAICFLFCNMNFWRALIFWIFFLLKILKFFDYQHFLKIVKILIFETQYQNQKVNVKLELIEIKPKLLFIIQIYEISSDVNMSKHHLSVKLIFVSNFYFIETPRNLKIFKKIYLRFICD